ncbi:MAG: serine/threonine-protein phosphatase, partial [Kiritimatiellae bacterium]|nr:serine/threonine-protein phosphatase [Kiritimatiellia bacterium]
VKRVIEGFDVYAILPKTTAAIERNTLVGSSAVMTILALVFVAILVGIAISRFVKEQVEKRIQADMAMAKAIQANVLPSHFPPYPALVDKIDIFARMITAKEVGGDFYDFYFVGPSRLALVIADVSGKGVPAALFMMRAKATLQGYLKGGCGLAEAVASANDRLSENNDANMFVTAWVGVVDIATGETEYVNAGHNPPLVKRADGSVEFLVEKSGPPLAAMGGVPYRKRMLRLSPNDGLVLYTDGVTEAVNPALELYGESRLRETVTGLLGVRDAQVMLSGIVDSVGRFAGGAEQADDITLLAFKRKSVKIVPVEH